MKSIIFSVLLLVLSTMAGAAGFSAPVVVRQFQPAANAVNAARQKVNPVSPNIIPIITLNNKFMENGTPRHEPCAATRLTPTLLITAAHCLFGGLNRVSRVEAGLFTTEDGVEGLVFAKPNAQSFAKPNAQVFLYRPQFTDPNKIPVAFDFAVIVLDPELKFKSPSGQNALQQILDALPQSLRDRVGSPTDQIKQEFAKQAAAYAKFIGKKLDEVALLTITPQAVEDELRGRSLEAYFWNGYERSTKRDPLKILKETIKGTGSPKDSHLMLFSGEEFHPGTSGSPIFDTQRKAVVSVASGCTAKEKDSQGELRCVSNAGGLIDEALCQWVKRRDSAAKCLVRHEPEVVAVEQETR